MHSSHICSFLAVVLFGLATQLCAQQSDHPPVYPFDTNALRVRLGVPRVVRGPSGQAGDSTFSEIRLPYGIFRGFTGTGQSIAIDGNAPWDMSASGVVVLKAAETARHIMFYAIKLIYFFKMP